MEIRVIAAFAGILLIIIGILLIIVWYAIVMQRTTPHANGYNDILGCLCEILVFQRL